MSKSVLFKTVGIAVILVGIVLAFSACGGDGLVGKWTNDAEAASLELKSDGTAIMDDVTGTYKTEDDQLIITAEGMDVPFDYKLDGDTLTLSLMGEEIVFQRVK